jgi:hypothetical protein
MVFESLDRGSLKNPTRFDEIFFACFARSLTISALARLRLTGVLFLYLNSSNLQMILGTNASKWVSPNKNLTAPPAGA